jgi:hypothetical protein
MATQPQPLFYRGSDDLQIMSATDISNISAQVIAHYAANPSVVLTEVSSGGSLGNINDTRLQSGIARQSTTSVGGEGDTAEPTTVTTGFARINQTVTTVSQPTDPLPLYRRSDGQVQSFTPTDFLDTFIRPAITTLVLEANSTSQGGTFRIHTATSLSGHTLVSSTPVFIDTIADVSSFLSANIAGAGTVQDFPSTVSNYYLMRVDGASTSSTIRVPAFRRTDGDIQAYSLTSWNALLEGYIRYATSNSSGDKITYSISSGTAKGSGMVDTILNGSGDFQSRAFGVDDYRSQEFPNGVSSTASTTFLRINRS